MTDEELDAKFYEIAINSDQHSAVTFTVTYNASTDSNVFMFGSQEVEGILVSNTTKFGRSSASNERLNLTHQQGRGGLFRNIIANPIIRTLNKRQRTHERQQNH